MVILTRADLRSIQNAVEGTDGPRRILEAIRQAFIVTEKGGFAEPTDEVQWDLTDEDRATIDEAMTAWIQRFDPAGRAGTIGNLRATQAKVRAGPP